MTVTIRPVDPARDARLIHSWVDTERGAYWGMVGKDLEEVQAIYAYIDAQPHLAAYLLGIDEHPLCLFQTYDPAVDEIGGHYDRWPGDVGLHLFLADDPRRAGRTGRILRHIVHWVFADPAARRIVLEPDVRNAKSVSLFRDLGAEMGPVVQMPHKRAQFAFLTPASLVSP